MYRHSGPTAKEDQIGQASDLTEADARDPRVEIIELSRGPM
jgi:hypothetical protein